MTTTRTPGEQLRHDAREGFKAAGLTYADATPENLRRLRQLINSSMIISGAILGTFRARQRWHVQETPSGTYRELRCKADYFDDREAITFNTDGFIGFAGWADAGNVAPIVTAFNAWVAELSAAKQQEKQA